MEDAARKRGVRYLIVERTWVDPSALALDAGCVLVAHEGGFNLYDLLAAAAMTPPAGRTLPLLPAWSSSGRSPTSTRETSAVPASPPGEAPPRETARLSLSTTREVKRAGLDTYWPAVNPVVWEASNNRARLPKLGTGLLLPAGRRALYWDASYRNPRFSSSAAKHRPHPRDTGPVPRLLVSLPSQQAPSDP